MYFIHHSVDYHDYKYKSKERYQIRSNDPKITSLSDFFRHNNVSKNRYLYLKIMCQYQQIELKYNRYQMIDLKKDYAGYILAEFKTKEEAEDFFNNVINPLAIAKKLIGKVNED